MRPVMIKVFLVLSAFLSLVTMALGKGVTGLYVGLSVLWLAGSAILEESFELFRGKHDIFSNLKCLQVVGDHGSGCSKSCHDFNAVCNDTKDCKYCICKKNESKTFVGSTSGEGMCVKDEEIVPESGLFAIILIQSFLYRVPTLFLVVLSGTLTSYIISSIFTSSSYEKWSDDILT